MSESPADELRDLFALAIREANLRWRGGSDEEYYAGLADAVVDLFDLVERQRTESGHCYVARTKEETP